MTPNSLSSLLLPLSLSLLCIGACDGGTDGDGASGADAGDQCATTFYADDDGDGYGDDATGESHCDPPDGYVALAGDCDDDNADVHPGGVEVCDGSDNDCNGLLDSADPAIDLSTERLYFLDDDGDGYGDGSEGMTSCDQPTGYVPDDTDCDDSRGEVNPGEVEVCDGLDNNCDSLSDDDDEFLDLSTATTYYADSDGDGYGVGAGVIACTAPAEHAEQAGDCDDDAAAANPGETEICDGLDNDCDGGTDGTAADPNQCAAYPGVFAGPYTIRAQEKLGSIVINDMRCNGTASITIDLSAEPAVQGTVTCNRVGGLIIFNSTQTGTITGDIDLDGNIVGTLRHQYNDTVARNYNFTTTVTGDQLAISGTGTVLPHPQGAVAWEVTYSVDAGR